MEFEKVGEKFTEHDMDACQERAWRLLKELSGLINPGMTEDEARIIAKDLFEKYGAEKNWHPLKIRFGKNTLKTFRDISEPDIRLQENDIFFLDLGPVFNGFEGDVGKTFVVGKSAAAEKLIAAGEEIFNRVRDRWSKTGDSGEKLYAYASSLAVEFGYRLATTGGNGHRISEFPHALYHKGSLKEYSQAPTPYRWILEIQLHDDANQMGSFFEDILK